MVDEQKEMTAEVCFEFCSTVPSMVYFGLTQGRECYCTPYWKPSAEGTGNCDLPCPGDPTIMCGGDEKSSIYEMHKCEGTADTLNFLAEVAGQELMYFYQNADQLKWYSDETFKSGRKLEQAAGAGGDPVAADLGLSANKASSVAAKLLVDGTCAQS